MTLYGLIATFMICMTIAVCVWLLIKYPITILFRKHLTIKNEQDPMQQDNAALEEQLNPKKETNGMDDLISAVNDLMGIQTQEDNLNE